MALIINSAEAEDVPMMLSTVDTADILLSSAGSVWKQASSLEPVSEATLDETKCQVRCDR